MKKMTIEVRKNENESTGSLLRRFSKKVRESGVLVEARSLRYKRRQKSGLKKKRDALRRIDVKKRIEKLKKLGKID